MEEEIITKQELEAIFDEVPGGIVLYKWTGTELKTLQMSRFYEERYGYSMRNDSGSPDFMRIHPDDIEDYQKAIHKGLVEDHYLEYVFRVWNQNTNKYGWTQINAVSKPQPDGTDLVYAMYTDVTEQKVAEQRLKKSKASIMAALGAAEQFSYEYDPIAHTSTSFTEDNKGYDLDTVIRNYPECFRDMDFMHPDDVEMFIETTHQIDQGADRAHCNIRANKDGRYHWHSCTFDAFYDSEKERRVALLTVVDITPQMMAMRNYEKRLKALTRIKDDVLCMCDVNLTKNEFSNVQAQGVIRECSEKAKGITEFIELASRYIPDEKDRKEYCELFCRENMLALLEKEESHIQYEHYFRIGEKHTEWVETVFDFIVDPVSGNAVGICYAKSKNRAKLSRVLLDAALKKDYPMAGIVYEDTDEFYIYENGAGTYCEHRENYWQRVHDRLAEVANKKDLEEIRSHLTRELVLSYLQNHEEYTYVFYATYREKKCRLETKFQYVDKQHGMILATLRNITDTALYEKYKYDGEHDELTGLLNRKTVFKKCRELLNSYPEEQFVLVHCDVRHFHLYNTFFGEKAGDELLYKIATVLSNLQKDYDHWTCGRIESDVFCAFFPIKSDLFERHVKYCLHELASYRDDFPLELAIGAYWVTEPSMSIEAMFSRATIAAKSGQKNLFGLIARYDEVMDQKLKDTQQITSEMQTAIAQEQFEVYLQPKYSLRSEQLTGAEALVRWKHPERGMISPGKFIPAFEQNGFIAELDRYMWEHVCQILQKWSREGKEMFPVSVNMSRVSMYSHATIPFLKELIKKYELDPKYLELELTESAYMDDPDDLKRMLKELQEFGFKILMDDFGSGYSSLNTLRELPVDVLKLDMKFLSETQNDRRGMAVLSSVVRMSKLLNLPIVAEGVEKREQADYLCSIGCEYVQGYLFARPMPVAEYEELLQENTGVETESFESESLPDLVSEEIVTKEPLVSLGILEYADERFVYLRTNRTFLREFDLIENLNPASKVFRQHLDDQNYRILLDAFARCSDTHKDVLFCISWTESMGDKRKYCGRVQYHGDIGTYADLSVEFLNVTDMDMLGFV